MYARLHRSSVQNAPSGARAPYDASATAMAIAMSQNEPLFVESHTRPESVVGLQVRPYRIIVHIRGLWPSNGQPMDEGSAIVVQRLNELELGVHERRQELVSAGNQLRGDDLRCHNADSRRVELDLTDRLVKHQLVIYGKAIEHAGVVELLWDDQSMNGNNRRRRKHRQRRTVEVHGEQLNVVEVHHDRRVNDRLAREQRGRHKQSALVRERREIWPPKRSLPEHEALPT